MQAELPDEDSRKAGPLGPLVAHSGFGYEQDKGQRDVTWQREIPRLGYLQNRMGSLPRDDVRRMAYFAAVNSRRLTDGSHPRW
jgi:hypothetical protein